MPKYIVHFQTVASATLEVEAEDRQAAIEEARQEGVPGICAQCSGWGRDYSIDLGEWETVDQGFTAVQAQSIEEAAEEIAP